MRRRTPDVTAAGFRLLLDHGQAVAIADLASAVHAPAEEAEKALDALVARGAARVDARRLARADLPPRTDINVVAYVRLGQQKDPVSLTHAQVRNRFATRRDFIVADLTRGIHQAVA